MRCWIWTIGLAALLGCGTVLHQTPEPLTADRLLQLRRGARQMKCREQPSAEFALFVVCPGRHKAIGFSAIDGKQALTCVDYLWPRRCRQLAQKLLIAGQQPVATTVPNAGP